MTEVVAELMGYDKQWVWLRVPYLRHFRILTLPRATLLRGYATAELINIKIDYDSFELKGPHYVADVELVSVCTTRKNQAVDTPEGTEPS